MTNKVIYNLKSTHQFSEYGIQIPLLNERVEETILALKETFHLLEMDYSGVSFEDLLLAHDKFFIDRVLTDPTKVVEETYELVNPDGSYNRYKPENAVQPLNDFIEKARLHVMGTYLAAKQSLVDGFCYHLGGGMHHAMSSRPGGFCMFNDLVIAIRKLQKERQIENAAIIDIDCHKGDGSAEITQGDPTIKTFSIHMEKGWPLNGEQGEKSFIPSDLDIPVDKSENYFSLLKEGLDKFLSTNTALDLVLVVHGVDVWEHDILPSSSGIKLSKNEVLRRDIYVYDSLKAKKIPQAWCLGGGYGEGVSALYIQFLKTL